jgi:glucose-1-phosphate cytidylyltransferase
MGTVRGINPPSRFGEIKIEGDHVVEFAEKPDLEGHWINGGFFFFRRDFCQRLSEAEHCVLERDPLMQLARSGQLNVFRHRGFWASMDTQRDREYLTKLVETGSPPWLA